MPLKLYWDNDVTELKSRLNSIIEIQQEDDLKTHFVQTMLFKHTGKVSGTVKQDHFNIWVQDQGAGGVTGIFYPVVTGHFRTLSHGVEIEFHSKMNIIGKSIFTAIAVSFVYTIMVGIIIQENNEVRFLIPRILIGLLLFGLMISVPSFIYFRTSRIIRKYLIKELGLLNTR